LLSKKVFCCLCNLIQFTNKYGQTKSGGLNASFFRRQDIFKSNSCRCEEFKRWRQPVKTYASAVKEGKKIEENEDDEDDKKRSCCFRSCGGAIGAEMSFGSRYNYVMNHQCDNCKCFEKQKKGDTRMLSGGYGSSIADDQDYQFVGPDDKFKEGELVCDWCINDMIYSGELVYLTGS